MATIYLRGALTVNEAGAWFAEASTFGTEVIAEVVEVASDEGRVRVASRGRDGRESDGDGLPDVPGVARDRGANGLVNAVRKS